MPQRTAATKFPYRVDKSKRPVFGKTLDGEVLYWPDISLLTVHVPAPLEQYLEQLAKRGYMGERPEEVAIHLLRDGIMERSVQKTTPGRTAPDFTTVFRPDPWRYMQRKPREPR